MGKEGTTAALVWEGRVPPSDIDGERAILGCMLLDQEALEGGIDTLNRGHFYSPVHSLIFDTCKRMAEKGEPVDLLTITQRLKADNNLDKVEGPGYLSGLVNVVPTIENLLHYAKVVRDLAGRRQIIRASMKASEMAYQKDDVISTADILLRIPNEVEEILGWDYEDPMAPLDRYKASVRNAIMEDDEPVERGMKTGYTRHDAEIGGIHPGRLYAWGGRPGHGKTTLLLNMGEGLLKNNPDSQNLFLSLEMQAPEVLDKLIAMRITREVGYPMIPVRAIQKRTAYRTHDVAKRHALKFGKGWIINDKRGMDIDEIIRTIRRMKRNNPSIRVVIIDYIQKIRDPKDKRDYTFYEKAVGSLFNECGLSDIAIIIASQVKREVSRERRLPSAADIYGGDALEQYADFIGGMCDPWITKPQEQKTYRESNLPRELLLQTIKNKHGPSILWKLKFFPTVSLMVREDETISDKEPEKAGPTQEELTLGETLNLDDDVDFFDEGKT